MSTIVQIKIKRRVLNDDEPTSEDAAERFKGRVWVAMWNQLLNWHQDDPFGLIAKRLDWDRWEVLHYFASPRNMLLDVFGDLFAAMDTFIDFDLSGIEEGDENQARED